MGITKDLCERICATGYDDLTEDAKTAARRLVLDGLAVAVAGSKQEASPGVLAGHLQEMALDLGLCDGTLKTEF